MTATSTPAPSAAPYTSGASRPFTPARHAGLPAELVAAVICVVDDEPVVRVIGAKSETGVSLGARLPAAMFEPEHYATLDMCLRATVLHETGLELGHVEQLQSAVALDDVTGPRLSIGYLALAHRPELALPDLVTTARPGWQSWYDYFPWEDWRRGRPRILRQEIIPRLEAWVREEDFADVDPSQTPRRHRLRMCFGDTEHMWDEEKVVDRFDLLSDAGLIAAVSHGGTPMLPEHRRCLAVAMSRLRTRLKSRPLVFDLMPARFTLFELQRTVEAILGPHLHKQNFRRLVEHAGLVEPTDEVKSHTGGRPAKLFRFRQQCLLERQQPGLRVRGSQQKG